MRPLRPAGPALTDEDLRRLRRAPDLGPGRMWTRMVFISSADGSAALEGRSGGLGSPADARQFALAREDADVILVGAGTVRAEGYEGPLLAPAACRRRAAEGRAPHPPVAVVSGSADLDPGSAFFAQAPVRPLVVTTDRAAREHPRRVAALAEAANVVTAGEEAVEGPALLAALAARGMRVVHGEGGPALFGSLAAADLVDELVLSIAPVLAGGSGPRVLAAPHDDGALPTRLHLVEVLHEDSMLFARYVHARHAGLLPGLDPAGVADGAPGPDREERA